MTIHVSFRPSPLLRRCCSLAACGLLAVVLVGCQEEEGIRRYQAPRPLEPPAPVEYKLPKGWEKARELAQFSIATFQVSDGADRAIITITPPGQAGGSLLDNVNRWRMQMKVAPLADDAQMRKEVRPIEVHGSKAYAVDLAGPEGAGQQRLLGVIVDREGKFWFLRMRGPAGLVEKQKAAFFDEFLPSVRFNADPGGKNG